VLRQIDSAPGILRWLPHTLHASQSCRDELASFPANPLRRRSSSPKLFVSRSDSFTASTVQFLCDGPTLRRVCKSARHNSSDGARHPERPVIRTAQARERRVRSRSFADTPTELWPRDVQPARRGRTIQRVPDCTLLEIGKERGLGGGVSAEPLARPRLARSVESHLFLFKYRLNFDFRQHGVVFAKD